jgi:threonine dehydratase
LSQIPSINDVYEARTRIEAHLAPTPLRNYPSLDESVGAEIWVKHENFLRLGAFKVRGGLNLLATLPPSNIANGVASASSGNHGQSIAFAAREHGVPCVMVVPDGANPGKVRSIQSLGAEVVFAGEFYDESRKAAQEIARERGLYYIDAANEGGLIAGVATCSLEVFEELADIDAMFVPVGAGSGASGACIVRNAIAPDTQVIGVQAEAAPAAQRSWKKRRLVSAPMQTEAEGLATAHAYELPQSILRENLQDFILVSEEAIISAVRDYIEHCHALVEGAGAASLAGARSVSGTFAGKRLVVIASGANISMAQLRRVVCGQPS